MHENEHGVRHVVHDGHDEGNLFQHNLVVSELGSLPLTDDDRRWGEDKMEMPKDAPRSRNTVREMPSL